MSDLSSAINPKILHRFSFKQMKLDASPKFVMEIDWTKTNDQYAFKVHSAAIKYFWMIYRQYSLKHGYSTKRKCCCYNVNLKRYKKILRIISHSL